MLAKTRAFQNIHLREYQFIVEVFIDRKPRVASLFLLLYFSCNL